MGKLNQASLFFSNRLELLCDRFKDNFLAHSPLDTQHVVVVPSAEIERWLKMRLALPEQWGIACGFQTFFLNHALGYLRDLFFTQGSGRYFPSALELLTSIEALLAEKVKSSEKIWEPIRRYLQGGNRAKRFHLAEYLATLFIRYGVYGGKACAHWEAHPQQWQEALWAEVMRTWEYPLRAFFTLQALRGPPPPLCVHLFSFSHLPPLHVHFFLQIAQQVPLYLYQLSPCLEFWSDVRLEDIAEGEGHPLLPLLGRVGQQMARTLEECDLVSTEDYALPDGPTQLAALQEAFLLFAPPAPPLEDPSVQIHGVCTLRREVEVLYNYLLSLVEEGGWEPRDMVVMAPDITPYVPYIQAIFKDPLPYQITDLPAQRYNTYVEGIFKLLNLEERRWSAPAVLELVGHATFCYPRPWTAEELAQIRMWVEGTGIRWGLDSAQRQRLLQEDFAVERLHEEVATWRAGMGQLLEELALPHEERTLPFTQAELLGEWITLLTALETTLKPLQTEQTLKEWAQFLDRVATTYFRRTDESAAFEKALVALHKAHLVAPERLYSFSLFEKFFSSCLHGEPTQVGGHKIQAVRFASLLPMRAVPAGAICLLGMSQETFPRKERLRSLDLLQQTSHPTDYTPSPVDFDRYLLLEALLSARRRLYISYQAYDPFDFSELPPSSLIEELQVYIAPAQRILHPRVGYARSYFDGTDDRLKNYSKADFALATALYAPPPAVHTPSLPLTLSVSSPDQECVLDMRDFIRAFRTPLAHFLAHTCRCQIQGALPLQEEENFQLSALYKGKVRRWGVDHSLAAARTRFERGGQVPLGLFGTRALHEVEEAVERVQQGLGGVQCNTLYLSGHAATNTTGALHVPPLEVRSRCGQLCTLVGKIEGVACTGLMVIDHLTVASAFKVWPQLAVLHAVHGALPEHVLQRVCFVRAGVYKEADSLLDLEVLPLLLEYYLLSMQTPTFLLPEWLEPILRGDAKKLQAVMDEGTYDPTGAWLQRRGEMPSAEEVLEQWGPWADRLFGRVYAAWF